MTDVDLRVRHSYDLFTNFSVGVHYLYNRDNGPLDTTGDRSSRTATIDFGCTF